MIITKVEEQVKNQDRVSVFIDHSFKFGITKNQAKQYNIVEGRELTEEIYQYILNNIVIDKAKYKALDYISYANRTEKQVRDKFKNSDYTEEVIDIVIEFLKKYNYIDDEEFSKNYIQYSSKYKNKSTRKIQQELYFKGITEKIELDEVLNEQENDNIFKLLIKFGYDKNVDKKQLDKIIRKLIYRGFNYTDVKKVMNDIDNKGY